jgi:excinuclease ABC subunit A
VHAYSIGLQFQVSPIHPLSSILATMPSSDIVIKGAREHNLRDVDVVLPRNRLICLTGVSGSGKSSLAFDTVYAEGQRRYVESLSSFARQFLGQMPKPDVDYIGGLCPSISISQKSAGNNPRSTVGTITEIHDDLRVLFARVGDGHCPQCGHPVTAQSREQIVARVLALPEGTQASILAPVIRGHKGEHRELFDEYLKQGFARARVDGQIVPLSSDPQLDRQMRHDIEIVVDRLAIKAATRPRLVEAIELALRIGKGNLIVSTGDESPAVGKVAARSTTNRRMHRRAGPGDAAGTDLVLSIDYACSDCGVSFEPPSPQLFSFNSPQGMCLECSGLGEIFSFDVAKLIPDPTLCFKRGCFELLGPWKDMGRWRRHVYQGTADTVERVRELPEGTMLATPWAELDEELQDLWLWGTGDLHITFTWRGGRAPMKYGGKFGGIIPDLLAKYQESQSRMKIRQLERYMNTICCPACEGQRLNAQACSVTITSNHPRFRDHPAGSLPEICRLAVSEAVDYFESLRLDTTRQFVAAELIKEIRGRLGFLQNVGLEYLSLDRTAPTLSGGESQRIRLAGQIGCGLVGVLYILDEPSIGLHPRDNDRLIDTLCDLRDLGNTVVVVEHDEDTMRASDHLIDFGPGPGVRGGQLVAAGGVDDLMQAAHSLTGKYLAGTRVIAIPERRRIESGTQPTRMPEPGGRTDSAATSPPAQPRRSRLAADPLPIPTPGSAWLSLRGARHNNLKNIDVSIPLGAFVCITGVSGSGKSSLVGDILVEALQRELNRGDGHPGAYDQLLGLEHLDKMISIDQSPIGRTPRSNPGTYIKLFDDIRNLFTQLPTAKQRGYKPGRFSFNVDGGRCPACEGNGSTRLEMDFLADVWVTCPICQGHRFNRETLSVQFKGHSISDVLEMDVQQALELFDNIPKIKHKLQTLHDVGLDYLKIGQPSPTLSGGEAQRIKLARELVKKSTGRTLYMLDEPTTGLHFHDIELLLNVLHGFVELGNTVVVVEHNLDVVKTADWIVDLGPEGGAGGGEIVASGTPEEVAACATSSTGQALARVLNRRSGPAVDRTRDRARDRASRRRQSPGSLATHIEVQGAAQHNLKHVDLKIPRDQMTVFCGPSGSGKSSLAMDTIYAEGQRRYVESLSSYARQFVSQMQKPQLERIEGLSPAIAIEQQNLGNTPRSTVGTSTEIYDYLRILMARLGTPHCPDCQVPVGTQTPDEIVDKVLSEAEGTRLYVMAPISIEVGQSYEALWDELRTRGFHRVRIDGETVSLDDPPAIDRRRKRKLEVIVDRITVRHDLRSRIAESIEVALSIGQGVLHVAYVTDQVAEGSWRIKSHSQHRVCESCGRSFDALMPHSFSFNSYLGWCPVCEGLGTETGANPAALIRSRQMSLEQGALLLWPNVHREVSQWMLRALSLGARIPLDVPLDELDSPQRRRLLHGTGDQWFAVHRGGGASSRQPALFQFQFKGLYPALEEAARLSPALRAKLEHLVDQVECSACGGSRLREDAAAVRFFDRTIDQLCRQPLGQLQQTIALWKLRGPQKKVAGELLREIQGRVRFLNDVGLHYLTLGRAAASLSGGEAQRIRLASQLGSGLCGVLYVLDEPTIGLHPRDNHRLLKALHKLRDLGNTLILVEHDREVIAGSDQIVDFGPGAGRHGGEVVAQGTPELIARHRKSVTGPYLSGKKAIEIPSNRRVNEEHAKQIWDAHRVILESASAVAIASPNGARIPRSELAQDHTRAARKARSRLTSGHELLTILDARHNNLQGVNVSIPLGTLTAISGVSGSGKSSLINDVLYAALAKTLHRASIVPGAHGSIVGLEHINKVVRVDQQPLGNSPTSNPATYTGVFELIRLLFAQLPDSKLRGYTSRRFSFNVPGGRCEECEGNGQRCIEMHFLPDVWVPCETCRGRRYNLETLQVRFHGHSVADVLELTCADALKLMENLPKIRRILQTLCDVGLDYLTLGQSAPTLSGGEAQRVKLAAELSRPDTGRTLYLLDEPTTGLHFDDLTKLLTVLNRLVDLGNTVVVIEHNLDVIKTADWIIDMGPEAGEGGGLVTVAGTPEQVVHQAQQNGKRRARSKSDAAKRSGEPVVSLTALALAPVLSEGPYRTRNIYDPTAQEQGGDRDVEIADVGQLVKMPWEVDGPKWHTEDRVGRHGERCRWDGHVLKEIVDRIHSLGTFSETDWNARSVVEIAGTIKSRGWFMHAITGETWLLRVKFRTSKSSFRREEVLNQFNLKTLNQLDDLPVYGNERRVRCKSLRGPWQEIEFRIHDWDEINTPEFWNFLSKAVEGFQNVTEHVALNPEEIMPWKKLGKKWHLSSRGFPLGKNVAWQPKRLEELFDLLEEVAGPGAEFVWTNQQLVHLCDSGQRQPWATVVTKRPDAVELALTGPKSLFGLGRIADLGSEPSLDGQHAEYDVMRIQLRNRRDFDDDRLREFLEEHLEGVRSTLAQTQ